MSRQVAVALVAALLLVLVASLAVPAHNALARFTRTASVTGNTFTTDTLNPPTNLGATGGGSITLNWTATVDTYASGYRVLRGTACGGPYSQIAEVTPRTATTYVDSPAPGIYYYVARAFFQNWESVNSGETSGLASASGVISFRAAASAGAPSGVLSLVINKPAGTVQNDVMIASIAVRPDTATITPPAGWTLVRRINNASANANSLAVYYRVAGASEPADYTWTFSTSTGSAGGIQTFSGVDTTTPVDVENGQATAASLSHATPSVTTTVADTMIVTSHGFSSSATWTPPNCMTEAFDAASGTVPSTAGIAIEGDYALQAAAGATGTKTAMASNNADAGSTHILALRPVGAPPSAPAVTSLAPAIGPTAGGNSVIITGSNLTGASAVTFGGTPAASFTVDSPSQITAVAPAHAAGTVDVLVTTPGGTSANTAADDYSYSPILFRAAASAGAASGALSLVINKPAGTVQNDVMIASIAVRPDTATITPPAGWTLIRRTDQAVGAQNSLAVYYKVAGGGEPANYTWTFSTSTGSAGGILAFSGVDTTTPINVENGQTTPNALTHATPSVTTTVANAMIVTSHEFSSAATWTPPAGMTEAVDVASATVPQSVAISLEVNYVIQPAAGATGTKTATASNDSDAGCTHILALRPAP